MSKAHVWMLQFMFPDHRHTQGGGGRVLGGGKTVLIKYGQWHCDPSALRSGTSVQSE